MPPPFAYALIAALLGLLCVDATLAAESTFIFNSSSDEQIVFALNADASTGDLYFHLSAPAGNSWVGVGIGAQMTNALMLIAYPDRNGSEVTLSPRIATGTSEPVYHTDLYVEVLDSNATAGNQNNQQLSVDAVCRNCSSWPGGHLSFTDTAQPFIFAVGPGSTLQSNSLSAGLQEHVFYGSFGMDMTQATSTDNETAAVPAGPYSLSGATTAASTSVDHNALLHAHGIIMCIVFILIIPVGALVLRLGQTVLGHAITQLVAVVLFLVAFAMGCVLSTMFVKSQHYGSAHQIIGLLVLLAFMTQLGLGIIHHHRYRVSQKKTLFSKIHLWLGPTIVVFGIINGGLGLAFADQTSYAVAYAVVAVAILIICGLIRSCSCLCRRRRRKGDGDDVSTPDPASKGPTPNGAEGYQYPQFGFQPSAEPYQYAPSHGYAGTAQSAPSTNAAIQHPSPPAYQEPAVPLRSLAAREVPILEPAPRPRTRENPSGSQ